jgi:hypothetical protein
MDESRKKTEQVLALGIETFTRASVGPWQLREHKNPVTIRNAKKFELLNADNDSIASIECKVEDMRLIMQAVAAFPDFIKTLKSILDQQDKINQMIEKDEIEKDNSS